MPMFVATSRPHVVFFQPPAQSTLQTGLLSPVVKRSKQINYLHVVPKINKRMEPYLHFYMFFSRHLSILLIEARLLLSIPKAKCYLTENFKSLCYYQMAVWSSNLHSNFYIFRVRKRNVTMPCVCCYKGTGFEYRILNSSQ
jgi:hypothetical protein